MSSGALVRTVNVGSGAITTNAETVVATLQIPSTGPNLQNVTLHGALTLITGTGTSGVTLRIRRTSLTGALVGQAVADQIFAPAAVAEETHTIDVVDTPGDTAGQTYVLTALQFSGTANGTVVNAQLSAALSS